MMKFDGFHWAMIVAFVITFLFVTVVVPSFFH